MKFASMLLITLVVMVLGVCTITQAKADSYSGQPVIAAAADHGMTVQLAEGDDDDNSDDDNADDSDSDDSSNDTDNGGNDNSGNDEIDFPAE